MAKKKARGAAWDQGDESDEGTETQGDVAVTEEVEEETKEPAKFAVILHNDDYTTMDFVVEVLLKFFQKSKTEAIAVMLSVHRSGKGVAGIYPFEIAETKVGQVMDFARRHQHPLQCTMEKE